MTPAINKSRRHRGASFGSWEERRTIDYTRFYLFISVIAILIAATVVVLYRSELSGGGDDEEEYVDTVTINCYNPSHGIIPNGTAQFVFLVENSAKSSTSNFVKLEVISKPEGWKAEFPVPYIIVPKESTRLAFLTVTGPEEAESGIETFIVRAKSTTFDGESVAEVDVKPEPKTDNRTVESMDHLFVDYVGYLEDGRIFDTSVESVANSDVPKTDDFSVRGSYSQFDFTHDNEPRDVIPGFDNGVFGMEMDQTKVIVVPKDQGYTTEGHALYDKVLYFELTLHDIDRP